MLVFGRVVDSSGGGLVVVRLSQAAPDLLLPRRPDQYFGRARGRNQHSTRMMRPDLVLVFGRVVGSSGDGCLTPKQRQTVEAVSAEQRSLAAKAVQTVGAVAVVVAVVAVVALRAAALVVLAN